MITDLAMWAFRISIAVIAWFGVETFREVQSEIHDLRVDVKEIGKDVNSVRERVSRMEGKMDK